MLTSDPSEATRSFGYDHNLLELHPCLTDAEVRLDVRSNPYLQRKAVIRQIVTPLQAAPKYGREVLRASEKSYHLLLRSLNRDLRNNIDPHGTLCRVLVPWRSGWWEIQTGEIQGGQARPEFEALAADVSLLLKSHSAGIHEGMSQALIQRAAERLCSASGLRLGRKLEQTRTGTYGFPQAPDYQALLGDTELTLRWTTGRVAAVAGATLRQRGWRWVITWDTEEFWYSQGQRQSYVAVGWPEPKADLGLRWSAPAHYDQATGYLQHHTRNASPPKGVRIITLEELSQEVRESKALSASSVGTKQAQ